MRQKRHPAIEALLESPWAIQPTYLSRILDWARQGMLEPAATTLVALDGAHDGAVVVAGVKVIPVYGAIEHRSDWMMKYFGGCSVDGIREELATALADQAITAIVLDIDSPGGTIAGVTELCAEIRAARGGEKPIVAVANTLAASAAYWIAAQADEVVATPSGHVGSIGVYAVHQDISRMLDELGVTMTLISAGEHKTEGNEYEPLPPEARDDIQARVDAAYGQFKSDVAAGRRVQAAQVEADFGGGRVLTARNALAAGMVDRVESLGQTVQRLGKPGGRRRAITAAAGGPMLAGPTTVTLAADETIVPVTGAVPATGAGDDGSFREEPSDENGGVAEEPADDDAAAGAAGQAPFGERLTSLVDEADALLGHARERARLRAKEGRPAFSTTTESSLRAIRGAIEDLLALDDPAASEPPEAPVDPAPEAAPTPPVAAPPIATRFRSRADWIRYLEAPTHR